MKKVCKKCGIEKPVSDFGKGGKQLRADGNLKQYYHTTCKQCVNTPRVRKDNVDPKVCNKCGVSKPLAEYHYEKDRDRYRGQCKSCKNTTRRKRYPKVKDKLNERCRYRWANEPGYAEKQRETGRKSREKYKDIWNANHRERYANDPIYREKLKQEQRDRWANNPEHRAKSKETTRKWIEKNRERYDANNDRYYQENKEKIRLYGKQYREENPEHHKKLRKAQYEKHQEKRVGDQRKLRKNRRLHLIERLGEKCVECGTTDLLEFDHIDPLEKTFTIAAKLTAPIEVLYEEVDKCQLLCRYCHYEKTKNEWLDGTLYEKRYGEEKD
tara:strand:+ start:152 stop:1129 length:978 start_codon:yes stop_codon:yes gene_type:complete